MLKVAKVQWASKSLRPKSHSHLFSLIPSYFNPTRNYASQIGKKKGKKEKQNDIEEFEKMKILDRQKRKKNIAKYVEKFRIGSVSLPPAFVETSRDTLKGF